MGYDVMLSHNIMVQDEGRETASTEGLLRIVSDEFDNMSSGEWYSALFIKVTDVDSCPLPESILLL